MDRAEIIKEVMATLELEEVDMQLEDMQIVTVGPCLILEPKGVDHHDTGRK